MAAILIDGTVDMVVVFVVVPAVDILIVVCYRKPFILSNCKSNTLLTHEWYHEEMGLLGHCFTCHGKGS